MQKRKMVARAKPLMEKTPTPTVISASVQPDLDLRLDLIYIVLDAVFGDVGCDGSRMGDAAGIGPLQRHRELAHVSGVAGCAAAEGRVAYPELTVINDALGVRAIARIVGFGEAGGNKVRCGNLVPIVEPDAFQPLHHHLSRALLLPGDAHHQQAVIDGAHHPAPEHSNDCGSHHYFGERNATVGLFAKRDLHSSFIRSLRPKPHKHNVSATSRPVFIVSTALPTISRLQSPARFLFFCAMREQLPCQVVRTELLSSLTESPDRSVRNLKTGK